MDRLNGGPKRLLALAGLNSWDGLALAALFGATALLLWQYLFTWPTPLIFPKSSLGTDLPREVWPLARFIADTLKQTGEIPLWRPYQTSGAPLIGHPVAPVFYPLHWLALVLPLPLALNLGALFHLWWCGAGLYLYLRWQANLHPLAAFIGAVLLAHSPKWIAHLSGGHWPTFVAIAWWPWVWLAFASYWSTGRMRWAVFLGVALAAQALNHGTYLAISLVGLLPATVAHIRPSLFDWLRRATAGWGVALIVLAGLTAGQIWPLLELLPYTTRTTLTSAEAAFGSLPPSLLVALFFPPKLKFPEWFIVPGTGAIMLVALGWAGGWSNRERKWAIAALIGLVMSLGGNTPLYWLLYRLPGFSMFRNPSRWSIFTLSALSVLAAYAADKWLSGQPLSKRHVTLTLSIFGLLYLLTAGINFFLPDAFPFETVPPAVTALALIILLLQPPSLWKGIVVALIVIADLWWIAGGLIRPEPESNVTHADPVALFLAPSAENGERSFAPYGGLSAPMLVTYNLRAADGYDPFQLASYAELARRAGGCAFDGYAVAVPPTQASPEATIACPHFQPVKRLLALLNIRYVILPAPANLADMPLVFTNADRWVYEVGHGNGPAFGVVSWETAPSSGCINRLIEINPATQALVAESILPVVPNAVAPSVRLRETGVNGETFVVDAATPGLLIRSEAWAPGWRVFVDDSPAKLERVDCALQGVWLDAGPHRVKFEYRPISYEIGRWVSASMVLILIGWAVYYARRRL